ncbi:acyltransferase [Metasolibacillus meyeri]|uniref:acyltransferase n=1 Tax=Metasolibacillus meyeri TaxID=1071052 RepID=UPI000D31C233|nr:acyltransferase [Metasolibacillus meyeri]
MHRNIVVFGTGQYSAYVTSVIKDIIYYVDNYNFDTEFRGKRVYSFDKLLNENKDNIFIVIASTYFEEISKQLIAAGFNYELEFIEYERFIEIFPEYLSIIYQDVKFGNGVQLIGMKDISIGKGTIIADNTWINDSVRDNKCQIKIGEKCLIGKNALINGASYLEIGDFCLLAPNVYISNADHTYENINIPIMYQTTKNLGELIIEENVWIGINVVVTGGIRIGRGSVIGANTVVKKDIPPFSIVVGNPAKIIKMYNPQNSTWERTDSIEKINKILEIRETTKFPSREEYKNHLYQKDIYKGIDPVLVGKGRSI